MSDICRGVHCCFGHNATAVLLRENNKVISSLNEAAVKNPDSSGEKKNLKYVTKEKE